MEFDDGAHWWKPDPMHVQECIEKLALAGGEAVLSFGTKDTMKKFVEAKDSVSDVESTNFQRSFCQMVHQSDSVRDGHGDVGCVQANSWSSGEDDAGDTPDRPHQQMAVLLDADHASDETIRKNLSCHHICLEHCLIPTQLLAKQRLRCHRVIQRFS